MATLSIRLGHVAGQAGCVALLLLSVVACANPRVHSPLSIEEAPPFTAVGEEPLPNPWWIAFDNPALNAQIDLALGENYTLAGAWERVNAAQALAFRESTDLLPDLDGFAEAGGVFGPGADRPFYGLGVEASYEPDLWGRIGWRVEAERTRASATLADFQDSALTLSAEIARTWYALVEAKAQAALVKEQIETNEEGLTLLEGRFGQGQIQSADVLRQRQLVKSTYEQGVSVQARIELLEHRLAVLQARAPQTAGYDAGVDLPDLPPLPATGLPSEMLQRRPDVRREYLALWAADRDVASAVSDQYPRLNLTASLSTAAESPENLFRDWFASIAGQLVGPIFDAGQRRAEIDRTSAVVRQRVAEYCQTVLNAYRQVEDALAREKYAQQRIVLLKEQMDLAEETAAQLRLQYITGVTDYIAILSAITEQQRLQREYLSTRLELVLARIELYRALSGEIPGFPTLPEGCPPPQPVSDE